MKCPQIILFAFVWSLVVALPGAQAVYWGLDRVDQCVLPLDNQANFSGDGSGYTIWVIGSGIDTDPDGNDTEFGGRAQQVVNFAGGENVDCNGTGTHAASIAAGNTYGIARGAQVRGVKVVGCNGSGSPSVVISGLEYVQNNADGSSVALLTVGGAEFSPTLDTAVRNLILSGVPVIIAAGSDGEDCNDSSPARVEEAIVVGASTADDSVAQFSNQGSCVDLFAPGVAVRGAWHSSENGRTLDGTMSSAAFVAGAMVLSGKSWTALEQKLATGVLSGVNSGTANKMLYTGPGTCAGAAGVSHATLYAEQWGDAAHDRFGSTLALDENRVAVGAPYEDAGQPGEDGGLVYVYDCKDLQCAPQIIADPTGSRIFGYRVALDGDVLAVVSKYPSLTAEEEVEVYARSTTGEWVHSQTITVSGQNIDGVVVDGNVLAVHSSEFDQTDDGFFEVFEYGYNPDTLSDEWLSALRVDGVDLGVAGQRIGMSLALEDDKLVVAAQNPAQLYDYRRQANGTWTNVGTISLPTGGTYNSDFRDLASLDLSQGQLIVGNGHDPNLPVQEPATTDAVHIYNYSAVSDGWVFAQTLEEAVSTRGDLYGASVAISGDLAMVGAPGNVNQGGLVWVYQKNAGVWGLTEWLQSGEISPGDPSFFGAVLAINSATAMVGAPWTTMSSDDYAGALFYKYYLSNECKGMVCEGGAQGFCDPDGNAVQEESICSQDVCSYSGVMAPLACPDGCYAGQCVSPEDCAPLPAECDDINSIYRVYSPGVWTGSACDYSTSFEEFEVAGCADGRPYDVEEDCSRSCYQEPMCVGDTVVRYEITSCDVDAGCVFNQVSDPDPCDYGCEAGACLPFFDQDSDGSHDGCTGGDCCDEGRLVAAGLPLKGYVTEQADLDNAVSYEYQPDAGTGCGGSIDVTLDIPLCNGIDPDWDMTTRGDWVQQYQVIPAHTYCASGDPASCTPCADGCAAGACVSPPAEPQPPELPDSYIPPFMEQISFLFSGGEAVQMGLDASALDEKRVVVLRGVVREMDGGVETALPGVTVTVLGHPEYGQTITRDDGVFDMVVNGGGKVVVKFEKDGLLTAQRTVQTRWNEYVPVTAVTLIEQDANPDTLVLDDSALQVAAGEVVDDARGLTPRQGLLFLPPNTEAEMVMPDGTRYPMEGNIDIAITEFTVGSENIPAMPSELPATTMYNYCIEVNSLEAIARGAKTVEFSQPAYYYVENFLGHPVGATVPNGYYDNERGLWVPDKNGIVMKIVGVEAGAAVLDIDGTGQAALPVLLDHLGITPAERVKLMELYGLGDEVWRVPVEHMTPFDHNMPMWEREDVDKPKPTKGPQKSGKNVENDCTRSGSTIYCNNQALGEEIPIANTNLDLVYSSGRTAGRSDYRTLDIMFANDEFCSSAAFTNVVSFELEVRVAGRRYQYRECCDPPAGVASCATPGDHCEPPIPEDLICDRDAGTAKLFRFDAWDGKDAFGRTVHGVTTAAVRLSNNYSVIPYYSSFFGRMMNPNIAFGPWPGEGWVAFGSGGGSAASAGTAGPAPILGWSAAASAGPNLTFDGARVAYNTLFHEVPIGAPTVRPLGLEGWSVSNHHVYDGASSTIYYGDGTHRKVETLDPVAVPIRNADDTGVLTGDPWVAIAPDGTEYYGQSWSVNPSCSGCEYGLWDSVLRVRRTESGVERVTIPLDFSEWSQGPCVTEYGRAPITLEKVKTVEVGPDGHLYVLAGKIPWGGGGAPTHTQHVAKINVETGLVTLFAGCGPKNGSSLKHGALDVAIKDTSDIAFGNDGWMYLTSRLQFGGTETYRTLWGLSPDGIFTELSLPELDAFWGWFPQTGNVSYPADLAVGHRGELYMTAQVPSTGRKFIYKRSPDGNWEELCTNVAGFAGDGGDVAEASFSNIRDIAVDKKGNLFVMDSGNQRVRRISADGTVNTVAGLGGGPNNVSSCYSELPALLTGGSPSRAAVSPAGELYYRASCTGTGVLRRIVPVIGSGLIANRTVASEDGSELYLFDSLDRHVQTLDAITGTTKWSFGYDSDDHLASITDHAGNVVSLTEDVGGLEISIDPPTYGTSATAQELRTTLTLDSDNKQLLAKVSTPLAEEYSMDYGADGDSADGLLVEFQTPRLTNRYYGYDTMGRLTSATEPTFGAYSSALPMKTLDRPVVGVVQDMVFTTAEGLETTYQVGLDQDNNWYRTSTGPDDLTTQITYLYDEDDDSAPRGYDLDKADGTLVTLREEDDPRWEYQTPVRDVTVATAGGLTMALDQEREATCMVGTTEKACHETTDRLGLLHRLTETTSISGAPASTREYTALDMTWANITPEGRSSIVGLDALGRPEYFAAVDNTTDQVPVENPGHVVYDATTGLVNQVWVGDGQMDPEIRVTDLDLDFAGGEWVQTVTDAEGQDHVRTYDVNGRVTSATTPDLRTVAFRYDANGNLEGVVPPGREEHVFAYDANDNMDQYIPVISDDTVVAYDSDQRVDQITRGIDYVIDYDYEDGGIDDGRLKKLDLYEGVAVVGTVGVGYYDATEAGRAGKLASMDRSVYDGVSDAVSLGFDWDGDLLESQTFASTYVNGEVTTTYYDGTLRPHVQYVHEGIGGTAILPVDYEYDYDGLITTAGALSIVRDPETGKPTSTTLTPSIHSSLGYNAFGELESDAYTSNHTGDLYSVEYERDRLGRVIMKDETVDGERQVFYYYYDLGGRLIEVYSPPAPPTPALAWESYAKPIEDIVTDVRFEGNDGLNGNRTYYSDARTGVTVAAPVYDEEDRLLSYGSASYTYRSSGELESKLDGGVTTDYDYDALGNLLSVTASDDSIDVEYVVDPMNRRIGKKVDGVLEYGLLYADALNPIAEMDGSGVIVSRFGYGTRVNVPDYFDSTKEDGTWRRYRIISDQLGSPRLIVDVSDGRIVQKVSYDEFGKVIERLDWNVDGSTIAARPGLIPFGFAGGLYDAETGLVRFGARDYDPEVGRWTAKDPILFAGGDTNLYGYTFNDPVNWIDINGQEPITLTVVVTLAVFNGFLGAIHGAAVAAASNADTAGIVGAALAGFGIGAVMSIFPIAGYATGSIWMATGFSTVGTLISSLSNMGDIIEASESCRI